MQLVPGGMSGNDADLFQVLACLARRLLAYPGVAGALYRRKANTVEFRIIAPRPISKLVQILATTWTDELGDLYPSADWAVTVGHDLPRDVGQYHCLFWRRC